MIFTPEFESYRIFMAILAVLKIGSHSWYMSFGDQYGYEALASEVMEAE